jgi:hypothetical protein
VGLERIDRRDKDTKGPLKVVFKGTTSMVRTRIWWLVSETLKSIK